MRQPDPPIQMRRYLTVAKRQGIPFDEAWRWADKRTVYPSAPKGRKQYKAAVEWARPAFEAAYHDREVPGGEACLIVAQTLAHEGNHATSHTATFTNSVPREDRTAA